MTPMISLSEDSPAWLAEMNRRVLAGRPIPAPLLAQLEEAYAALADIWGPPGLAPVNPLREAHRRANQPVCIIAHPGR